MADTYLFHVDPASAADPGDELAIQVRFQSKLRHQMPRVRFVAVPNGGQRTVWSAMKAKQEGLSAGFPDSLCIWPGTTAYIEFKDRKGVIPDNQIEWLNWLHLAGFPCGVFRSAETAIQFLLDAGAPSLMGIAA